jgi:hypothetical protein
MGAYSIIEPDQKILDQLRGKKSTLIVGCTRCANISLAHDKNRPVYRMTTDKVTDERTYEAVAIAEEAERLVHLLERHGIEAETETSRALYCAPWSDQTDIFDTLGYPPVYHGHGIDSVVVLACSQGLRGMERRVEKGVKVVWGMSPVGRSHDPILVYDPKSGYVTLDESKSKF